MSYAIRKALPADAEAISALVNSAYRGESSRAGWTTEADFLDGTRTDGDAVREIIERPGHVILLAADEHQQLLGCVEMRFQSRDLYFGMLSVQPTLQNKGIGRILLNTMEQEGRAAGCQRLFMNVLSERRELIAWYERLGFYDTGKRVPFQFSDPRFGFPKKPLEFVVMEKSLV